MYNNHRSKGCVGTLNPKKWKWVKETTSFSSGLGTTLVLSGTLHPIASATSGITMYNHSSLNALWSVVDFVHCMVMVLAGGISGAKGTVGWREKALGWKKKIWGGKVHDHRRQQITRGTTPRPTTTDTFAWVGGLPSPCHINATGSEANVPAGAAC